MISSSTVLCTECYSRLPETWWYFNFFRLATQTNCMLWSFQLFVPFSLKKIQNKQKTKQGFDGNNKTIIFFFLAPIFSDFCGEIQKQALVITDMTMNEWMNENLSGFSLSTWSLTNHGSCILMCTLPQKHSVSRQKHRATIMTKISQVVDDARTWTQNTSLKCNGTNQNHEC